MSAVETQSDVGVCSAVLEDMLGEPHDRRRVVDAQPVDASGQQLTERRFLPFGAERSPGAQAKCRSCREPIARGSWRIRLVFYEEGRFAPGGFVHLDCRKAYFETDDVLDRVLHFSRDLSADEREELRRASIIPSVSPQGDT